MTDECREAFEKWCDKEGRYAALEEDAWTVWQAAWNARRSPDARLTRSGADASMAWECTCGRLCLLEESKCDKCLKDRRP